MSERHKRCQYMNCCCRVTGRICTRFAGSIASAANGLGRITRRLTRRRQREFVRDDRAGVELLSVQQFSRPPSTCVQPCPTHLQIAVVVGDGPRETRPFHRSWYPRYPTLLAISKALDEMENAQKAAEKEKEQERTDTDDKTEELPKCDAAEKTSATSKEKQKESEQQYDWDVWSVESLEWNFDDEGSASSPSFG